MIDQLLEDHKIRYYQIRNNEFLYIGYKKNGKWQEGWLFEELVCDLASKSPIPPNDSPNPSEDGAEIFTRYYVNNYRKIQERVGFTINACAAYASTALKMYGYPVAYEEWAPTLRRDLRKLGWFKTTDKSLIKAGDIVFTRDAQTDYDGLTDHVYIVEKVLGRGIVLAVDNQGRSYRRNLYGVYGQSRMWDAYRPK